MKKKLISMILVAVILISLFGITPAFAAGSALVTFSGSTVVLRGQTYTITYTLHVNGACAANANISVGGAFEKVSGGDNLFYDTIPQNTSGTKSGTVTVRVKSNAPIGATGTISVLTDESNCSELLLDGFGNVVGDPIISTVTGSFSAVVSLETPSAPTVSPSGNGMLIQWNSISGATGYEVWRSTKRSGPFTGISWSGTTSYTDSDLPVGTPYYYIIRAVEDSTGNVFYGGFSSTGSAIAGGLGTPSAPNVTPYGNRLRVQWNAVVGATGYEVWRSTSPSGPFSGISWSGTTSYIDSGLSADKTYYYRIRTVNDSTGDVFYSGFSSNGSAVAFGLGTPSAPSVSPYGNKLRVQWNAVTGATGYEIWRSTSPTGSFSGISWSGTTSYTDSGLSAGKTYYYRIRAVHDATDVVFYGGFSSNGSAVALGLGTPSAPSVSPYGNRLRVQWTAVVGATGYEVWRSTSPTGPFLGISWSGTTSYTDYGLSAGKTYYYRIRAVDDANNTVFYGGFSSNGSAVAFGLGTPAAPSVAPSGNGMLIQWNAVTGATGYEVWRSTRRSGPFTAISWSGTTSYTDSNLPAGTPYYYIIRAVNDTDFVFYSDYSLTGSAVAGGLGTPSAPSVSPYGNRLRVQWNAAVGATGYEVWRSTSPDGPFSGISWSGTTSYIDSGLSAGKTYYYRIRTVNDSAGEVFYSGFSSNGSGKLGS